jgi:hypothetical protein
VVQAVLEVPIVQLVVQLVQVALALQEIPVLQVQVALVVLVAHRAKAHKVLKAVVDQVDQVVLQVEQVI